MKNGRAESVINNGKPSRPEDALLKGALDGRDAVHMLQLVDCLCWQPAQLPERTGKEYDQQSDEEDDPEAAGEPYRHSRKYKELSEAGQIGCPILTIVDLPRREDAKEQDDAQSHCGLRRPLTR